MALSPEKITKLVEASYDNELHAEAIFLLLKPGMITCTNLFQSIVQMYEKVEYNSLLDFRVYDYFKRLAQKMSPKHRSFDVLYAWSQSTSWPSFTLATELMVEHFNSRLDFDFCFRFLTRLSALTDMLPNSKTVPPLVSKRYDAPISRVRDMVANILYELQEVEVRLDVLKDCLATANNPTLLKFAFVLLNRYVPDYITLQDTVRCLQNGDSDLKAFVQNIYFKRISYENILKLGYDPLSFVQLVSDQDIEKFGGCFYELFKTSSTFHQEEWKSYWQTHEKEMLRYCIFEDGLGTHACMLLFQLCLYVFPQNVSGGMINACFVQNHVSKMDRAEMLNIIISDELFKLNYLHPARLLYAAFHENQHVFTDAKALIVTHAGSLKGAHPMQEFLHLVLKSGRDEVAFYRNYNTKSLYDLHLEEMFVLILEKNRDCFFTEEIWSLFDANTADPRMAKVVEALVVHDLEQQQDVSAYVKKYIGHLGRERFAQICKDHFPQKLLEICQEDIQKLL